MDRAKIETLLTEVRDGRTGVDEALGRLKDLPFEDLGFAKVDHHRALRTGMPEVIFAAGKTVAQVAEIFSRMAAPAATCWPRGLQLTCFARFATLSRAPSITRPPGPSRSPRLTPLRARERLPWCAREPATCRLPRKLW